MSDLLLWNKIGRIIALISKRLDIQPEVAFDLFYRSDTCCRLHDPDDFLYAMSDRYVLDDFILELRSR